MHTCLLCLSINAKKGYTCIHVVIFKYIINTIYVYIYTGINLYFNLLYLIALDLDIIIYIQRHSFLEGTSGACTHTHHTFTHWSPFLFSTLHHCPNVIWET